MYYFGARYYDAEIGLWTAADPSRQFWSPYLYVGNGYNPLNAVDLDGFLVIETQGDRSLPQQATIIKYKAANLVIAGVDIDEQIRTNPEMFPDRPAQIPLYPGTILKTEPGDLAMVKFLEDKSLVRLREKTLMTLDPPEVPRSFWQRLWDFFLPPEPAKPGTPTGVTSRKG